MADSDNSRTLPVVTRRRLLSTSAAWLAAQVGDMNAGLLHSDYGRSERGDPALILWQEWSTAHEQVEELCRKQQRLETALIAAVGFPHVEIAVPDQACVVAAFTMEQIDRKFCDVPENAEAKMQPCQAGGAEAFAMRGERFNDLFAQQAHSVAGAAAKLHAVVAMAEEDSSRDEFPWSQIRAAMADLLILGSRPSGI